jgi:hypothetical protein
VALLGLSGLIFAGVFFSADSFPGDFPDFYYTLPAYWIASVTAGEWPSWIPYVGMGMPLGAIAQSSILYPPLWIFPALHLPYTLKAASVLQVLHVWGGAAGCYVLVRRIFASTGVGFIAGAAYFCYGGFYVNAQHTDVVHAFALLPWLFWSLLLPTEQLRPVRAGPFVWCSAVSPVQLAVPAVTLLLVTGGYPGQLEALVAVVPVFVVLQLIRNFRDGQPLRGAFLDLAMLLLLLGLGTLLASAFLLPLAAGWDEVTRTSGGALSPSSLNYLHVHDLYGLVLSSNFVRPDLHRDIGMQLPLALFPFAMFLRVRTMWLLLPFYGIAALALVMALDVLTPVSRAVIALVPLLGYSRFPAGDYRTFLALAVLLTLSGAVHNALIGRHDGPRLTVRYLLGLGGLGLVLATAFLSATDTPAGVTAIARLVLAWQVAPAVVLGIMLVGARRRALRSYVPVAAAALCVTSAWPVLWDMHDDWQVHDAEHWLLNDAAMKLWADGVWRPDGVLLQHVVARPPRNATLKYPNEVSWNGYLNGEFLMRDDDGTILRQRRVVERQPDLMAFMQDGSRLLAVTCSPAVCDGGSEVHVEFASAMGDSPPGFAWQPVMYGRSSVRYRVTLALRTLVIENELYAPGWKAKIDGTSTVAPVRVNDALRGWLLPPGDYELELNFETPWLEIGVVASLAAALLYALILVAAGARSREVLLDPTGGQRGVQLADSFRQGVQRCTHVVALQHGLVLTETLQRGRESAHLGDLRRVGAGLRDQVGAGRRGQRLHVGGQVVDVGQERVLDVGDLRIEGGHRRDWR